MIYKASEAHIHILTTGAAPRRGAEGSRRAAGRKASGDFLTGLYSGR